MPAHTRSRGKAPPARVYHSSPAPAQLEFPPRRKVVRTYARQPHSAKLLRQSTLTQIGYIEPVEPEAFDMDLTPERRPHKRRKTMGDTPSSSFHTQTITQMLPNTRHDDSEDMEQFSELEDDEEEEEEEADENPGTPLKTGKQRPNKALSHVTDSRATSMVPQTPVHKKARKDTYEVPSSQPTPGTPFDTERFRIQPIRSPLRERTTNIRQSLTTVPAAETTSKRPRSMVIEDSYSSAPGLPSSDPIQPSPLKSQRLPYIKEGGSARASMELGELVPGRVADGVSDGPLPARPPLAEIGREIPDSDDEGLSLGPTPRKSAEAADSTSDHGSSLRTRTPVQTTPRACSSEDEREIESSDVKLDPGSPTPVARKAHSLLHPTPKRTGDMERAPSSPALSVISQSGRAVTPTPLSRNAQMRNQEAKAVGGDLPLARSPRPDASVVQGSTSSPALTHELQIDLTEETQGDALHDKVVTATPRTSQRSALKSSQPRSTRSSRSRTVRSEATAKTRDAEPQEELVISTPPSSQQSAAPNSPQLHGTRSRKVQLQVPGVSQEDEAAQDTPPSKSQFYTQTQGLESQRVPLEVIRAMAPQTDRSDIIISIHPEPAGLIANGTKDHEFRNYKILSTVSRIWVYVTSPICELRYMAVIGPAKQPGEIDDNSGVGNPDFNAGRGSKFAYELLQVYQLNNPVSLPKMKENGWVQAPPQKYTFIPPAVVGQLLGNLQRELFHDEPFSNMEESQMILSTPQQIEDQLRSDIIHSTQLEPEEAMDDAIVLSSQGEPAHVQQRTPGPRHNSNDGFARPQLPASKTPASVRRQPTIPQLPSLPPLPHNREGNATVRPSQATTASQPSSPPVSPDKTFPRPAYLSSGPAFPEYIEDDSLVRFTPGQHYSLGSSQLRLPESLLVDDMRQPPDIRDSDEEDEDE